MDSGQVHVARSKGLAITALILLFSFLVSVAFNIAVARQVFGFLFLTFVPGLLLIRVLKIDRLDAIENVLFSVGLSLSFLMIIGVLVNAIGPTMGIQEPLSVIPLMLLITIVILALFLFSYFRGTSLKLPEMGEVTAMHVTLVMVCLVLVILSVIGAYLVNVRPANNLVLIIMIFAIALLLGFSLFNRLIPSHFYPLILAAIAIALLFHSSLISNHLNGFDVQFEYYSIKTTVTNSQWYPNIYSKFQPLLSISILPAIYWNVLNIEGVWLSKIVYPLLFAFISLILYKLYRIWLSEKIAFLSVFLFMASNMFYTEMLTLDRQIVAELFFALLLLLFFTRKISTLSKSLCFIIFSFALVASHYAIAEIFLGIILLTWFIFHFIGKRNGATANIRIHLIAIFTTILFSWYIYVSSGAIFNELINMVDYVYRNTFTEFFNPESRGGTVLLGIGIGNAPPSMLNFTGRAWGYAIEILIIIGFIYLLIKRQNIFDKEFSIVLFVNMSLLALSIILPAFAGSLGMTRLYHVVLLSVSPLCIIGIRAISDFVFKSRKEFFTLAMAILILIPFFLFQTGVIYEIARVESYSIPLSGYRFDSSQYLGLGIIETTDISGVRWLSLHELSGSATIYSDVITDSILIRGGYGMFSPNQTEPITSNTTQISSNGIVYLRYYNLFYDLVAGDSFQWDALSYVNSTLIYTNKIYSNGMCEIYEKP